MKKTASLLLAITLISSLFYNVVDYYMMIAYQKEQSWIETIQNSPNSKFKVIKLNATLYSFMEDTDIEKVNENVIINNKIYHIFKKSIKDNVLNLYYLGVQDQTTIDLSLKKMADCQKDSDTNKSPIEKLIKSFIKDYIPSSSSFYELNSYACYTILNKNSHPYEIENSGYLEQAYAPPKTV
ncbi:hypothetical protein [Flavobacterium sp.]|uniref:hypothetical protein n=1 Tax=Flavobacterium sp. TaxID=239 RepID=UPI0037516F48